MHAERTNRVRRYRNPRYVPERLDPRTCGNPIYQRSDSERAGSLESHHYEPVTDTTGPFDLLYRSSDRSISVDLHVTPSTMSLFIIIVFFSGLTWDVMILFVCENDFFYFDLFLFIYLSVCIPFVTWTLLFAGSLFSAFFTGRSFYLFVEIVFLFVTILVYFVSRRRIEPDDTGTFLVGGCQTRS